MHTHHRIYGNKWNNNVRHNREQNEHDYHLAHEDYEKSCESEDYKKDLLQQQNKYQVQDYDDNEYANYGKRHHIQDYG